MVTGGQIGSDTSSVPSPRSRLAISVGDPNGIGIEVVLKAITQMGTVIPLDVVLFGSAAVIQYHAAHLGLAPTIFRDSASDDQRAPSRTLVPSIRIHDIDESTAESNFEVRFGVVDAHAGDLAMKSFHRAAEYCLDGGADALVTAPISKEAIQMAGYTNPGHTEYLASLCGSDSHLMMMVDGPFRVALVTAHIALSAVPGALSSERIRSKAAVLAASLQRDFGLTEPRIAVLGLNPHAGEAGSLGTEENTIITPAIEAANRDGIGLLGPFPADGFFGMARHLEFDAVLAMYHDQGLIPFKTLSFSTGVNYTAGLPLIRTSPDHGTAFDIAGKNVASSTSMERAVALALAVTHQRAKLST